MLQNHKIRPAAGGFDPRSSSVTSLSCISLFSTGPKFDNFEQNKLVLDQAPPPFQPDLSARMVALTAAHIFFILTIMLKFVKLHSFQWK